jgi:hypothetical protein
MIFFFHLENHNRCPNIPHDKVCIALTCLYNFRPFFSFKSIFLSPRLFVSVVFFILIVLMTGIVCHQELVLWMW